MYELFVPLKKSKKKHLLQKPIELPKNEVIMCFKTEVGPGVLQSSVQQTYNFIQPGQDRHNQLHATCAFSIPPTVVFPEPWSAALQVQSRFQRAQIGK